VLELLAALGPAAEEFVIAGAQAIKFAVKDARGTKDVDFILDVIAPRAEPLQLNEVLKQLGYTVVAGARNFQFEKRIPNSAETMRIEFMAPEEFKRPTDFRVDVQEGIHARACTGGTVALAESDKYPLEGSLPDGKPYAAKVRVTRSHALVMLKLLALYDRYHNIRGPKEAQHDREEAQTHPADIVAIVKARPHLADFKRQFEGQFRADPELGSRVNKILGDPGTHFIYSNMGYEILGAALSRAAGEPYVDYIQEHIFVPLGMRHTRFEPDEQTIPFLAKGYVLRDGLADPKKPTEELRNGRGYKVPNGAFFPNSLTVPACGSVGIFSWLLRTFECRQSRWVQRQGQSIIRCDVLPPWLDGHPACSFNAPVTFVLYPACCVCCWSGKVSRLTGAKLTRADAHIAGVYTVVVIFPSFRRALWATVPCEN
jgi:hypothetical protein